MEFELEHQRQACNREQKSRVQWLLYAAIYSVLAVVQGPLHVDNPIHVPEDGIAPAATYTILPSPRPESPSVSLHEFSPFQILGPDKTHSGLG
jgi:hypothetical protein